MPAVPALAAVLVALYGLDRRQLWRDEIATWVASTKSLRGLQDLVEGTDAVIAPYYLFMHGWIAVFGDSEVSIRMPSLLAIALAAALTAAIGRKLFDPATGLFAGLLVAVVPTISRYAQEARPYALAAAATVLGTLLLLRAAERPSWLRWLAYAGVVTVAGLMHLVALLLLLAHLVYVVSLRETKVTVRWFAAAATGVLPVLPVAWVGIDQAGQVGWIPEATWDSTINEMARVTGSIPVGAMIVGLAVLGACTLGRRGSLLGTWAIGPFFVLLLISPVAALLIHRYVLFTVPAWCLLAVATVARQAGTQRNTAAPRWRQQMLPAMLVLLCVALGLPAHASNREIVASGEPDLRGAVAVITAEAAANDAIAFHAKYPTRLRDGVDYYLGRAGRRSLPTVFTAWPGGAPAFPRHCKGGAKCVSSAERLWLISTSTADDQRSGVHPSLEKPLGALEPVRVVKLTGVTLSLWRSAPAA
ncbi:glycosyltransferase family 39 protein [Micromonospora sp. U21]|uniref:glycosyltransferase family 39 protein n=1 Tax=Micromonospora sp. U21 TaxID=2824899 RepID=UPI001B37C160|nr:glycosyltransferase family 39 protein [Micromonospora sp. U21]MBQ0900504.1 glycosyltransferase family 39 protein [Micromonospora sp. U21]